MSDTTIKAHRHLAALYLMSQVRGHSEPTTLSDNNLSHIEGDGRKRKRLMRELAEGDYITGDENTITNKALSEVEAEPVDLVEFWPTTLKGWNGQRGKTFDFVLFRIPETPRQRQDDLSLGQMKYLYEHADEFKWGVFCEDPIRYHMSFNPDKHWRDCDNFADIPAKLNELRSVENSGRLTTHYITVYTDALVEHVLQHQVDELVAENLPKMLRSGLVHYGIITKEEGELVSSCLQDASLRLTGLGLHVNGSPEEWGASINKSLDSTIADLEKLHKRLVLIRKIQDGIVEYGGWEKFTTDLTTALAEHYRKDLLGENNEDAEATPASAAV